MIFQKFHKIPQFRDVIRGVTHRARFIGIDEQGEPMYSNVELPTLKFKGTVKLHGTNAQICYDPSTEWKIKAGKRSSLLDTESEDAHMGFNKFVQDNRDDLIKWFDLIKCVNDPDNNQQMCVFGEWVGNGIQKGVGISQLPKSFFIFDACLVNKETKEEKWVDSSEFNPYIENIYNINDFQTFEMDIDFNNPKMSQNKLVELTNQVEKLCPVAKAFNIEGIGEGIVWTSFYKGEKFIF